jgi:hypothetical protein
MLFEFGTVKTAGKGFDVVETLGTFAKSASKVRRA